MRLSKLMRYMAPVLGMTHYVVGDEGGGDGGDDDAEGGAEGTANDARLKLMNDIADASELQREEELADVNDDDTTEPFKAKKPTDEEPEPESEPAKKLETEPDLTEERKFKIKVNGKELELTEAELIERAQKVEAADEYLRDAAEAKKKAVKSSESEIPKGPTPEELQRQQDEEDLRLARAIQVGTEEEATAALRKIRESARSASPSLSRDDVSRTIDERLAFNTAIEMFSKEYKDVWEDPTLKKLAFDRDAELLRNGDSRPYAERYMEIGKEISEWKKSLLTNSAPAKEVGETLETKEQRKASAPKSPAAASAKAKAPKAEEDDGEENPSSVIANMREQRGGPQWMRG